MAAAHMSPGQSHRKPPGEPPDSLPLRLQSRQELRQPRQCGDCCAPSRLDKWPPPVRNEHLTDRPFLHRRGLRAGCHQEDAGEPPCGQRPIPFRPGLLQPQRPDASKAPGLCVDRRRRALGGLRALRRQGLCGNNRNLRRHLRHRLSSQNGCMDGSRCTSSHSSQSPPAATTVDASLNRGCAPLSSAPRGAVPQSFVGANITLFKWKHDNGT